VPPIADGPLVECVPNFSEGRNRAVIEAIARSISAVPGQGLLGVEPGADANRSVYTFAGEPEAVAEAAFASAKTAFRLIDMARHSGVHPRMGALDVCPFVPISGIGMEGCVELSRRVAERIATELGVPVYLYEESASRPERRSLAYLRSGGYEALASKLARAEWAPDFGPAAFVPSWGATVVGARPFLIAFNVNLDGRDEAVAKEIAMRVRESGRPARGPDGEVKKGPKGESLRIAGRLRGVRAIGWYIEAYGCAQVSVNILDWQASPLHLVFETVREEAEALGCRVKGSELVGLAPLETMLRSGEHFLGEEPGARRGVRDEPRLLEAAVAAMGLDSVAPFPTGEKIVEYALAAALSGRPPVRGSA
jgi:glutamate formiminotransferase/formiminotetrahydrofolate cyclodeaminase